MVRAAADRGLSGRTLHLAQDFDGAYWKILESAADVLEQLAADRNLLKLPPGSLRVLHSADIRWSWLHIPLRRAAFRVALHALHTGSQRPP